MNSFCVNIGHILALPYESDYALARRCLIVNPGVPLAIIEENLRQKIPDCHSFTHRLSQLQLSPTHYPSSIFRYQKESYHTQCPQCAKELYHTDIFTFPWLERCPIHHCDLTTHCPACQLPWPDIKEISKRDCPNCGRTSLDQILKSVLATRKKGNYAIIADIYHLLDDKAFNHFHILDEIYPLERFYNYWWIDVPLSASQYPSFKAQTSASISDQKLHALNIKLHNIHCKQSKIIPLSKGEEELNQVLRDLPVNGFCEIQNDIIKSSAKQLAIDFAVMRNIVSWIARHTPSKHQIHVTSYRDMDMERLLKAPDPCPYCLALSLWFFHIASLHYGPNTTETIDSYPFFSNIGFDRFLHVCEPYFWVEDRHFRSDPEFASWFYQRGVILSFVDILRFAFDLLRQLHLYKSSDKRYLQASPYKGRIFSDQYYLADLNEEHLSFYYENEDPLDAYQPENIPNIDNLCRKYRESRTFYYALKSESFDIMIPNKGLSHDIFLSLHVNFGKYIQAMWRSFYPEWFKPSKYTASPCRILGTRPEQVPLGRGTQLSLI